MLASIKLFFIFTARPYKKRHLELWTFNVEIHTQTLYLK